MFPVLNKLQPVDCEWSDTVKKNFSSPAAATLTGQNHIFHSLCYYPADHSQRTAQRKRHFTGQTFIHNPSGSLAKLLFHQGFVHFSADGCSNRGLRELGGGGGGGYVESLFTRAEEINASLP